MRNLPLSRTWMYRVAWILFGLGVMISGWHVLGDAVVFSQQYANGVRPFRFAGMLLFVLSLFSNVIFLLFVTIVSGVDRVSAGWKTLLIGSSVVNLNMLFFFPGTAEEPGYWPWLAAFFLLTWSILVLPPDPAIAPRTTTKTVARLRPSTGTDVPTVLWVWLGFTVFWLLIETLAYVYPARQIATTKATGRFRSYVVDPSDVLTGVDEERVSQTLRAFEKETSNQIAVAVYPQAPNEEIDDFTIRAAQESGLGLKGRDNGGILFLFLKERIARVEVGYGLEGALPDGAVRRILDQKLAGSFAQGRYAEGLDGTLGAIMGRVRAEYPAGKPPGIVRITFAKIRTLGATAGPIVWPFLRDSSWDQRFGISFFGTLFGLGIASGIANGWRIFVNVFRACRNLLRGRPMGYGGWLSVEFESVWDTVAFLALLAVPVVAMVALIAGGGAFGGGGATIRW